MSDELQAARARLAELEAENMANRERLDGLRRECARLEARQRELLGEWGVRGLIESARMAARDAEWPIYQEAIEDSEALRIVVVDEHIYIRRDGERYGSSVSGYSRRTGKRLARFHRGPEKIDAKRALEVWAKHQAANATASPQERATAHATGPGDVRMPGRVEDSAERVV